MISRKTAKKKTVGWAKTALLDLQLIVEYIAARSPQNAKESLAKIKKECKVLESFPEMGKIPAELEAVHIEKYRELVVSPWRIFYRYNESGVVIVSVFDSRRNFDDIKISRMMRG